MQQLCIAQWPQHLDRDQAIGLYDQIGEWLMATADEGELQDIVDAIVADPEPLQIGTTVKVLDQAFMTTGGGNQTLLPDKLVGQLAAVQYGPDADGDYYVDFGGEERWYINGDCLEEQRP